VLMGRREVTGSGVGRQGVVGGRMEGVDDAET
jgi:hypothetical protein